MRILLLSDSTMSANAGGLSQTLYNIFSFCDSKNILCVVPEENYKAGPPSAPFQNSYVTYVFQLIPLTRNRFSKYINPYIDWFNYAFNSYFRKFTNIKLKIEEFSPDIIISCSNGPVGLFMHHKLIPLSKCKVFPYFMDDWMFQKRYRWLDKQVFYWAKKILSDNTSWMMISKQLAAILEERYGVIAQNVLEIHNPVDLSNAPDFRISDKRPPYTLAYAGALWPMHFDAFLVVAKSVQQLNRRIKIDLVLYTDSNFWNWRKAELNPLGVKYGGSIPYSQIHQKLHEADALVVVSSFKEEWYTHSKGSVQTKITDYLKSKSLIISCGPAYSANHYFLKQNNCGICIESNDYNFVSNELERIILNTENYESFISNGWKVLEKDFTFSSVYKKLVDFVSVSTVSN